VSHTQLERTANASVTEGGKKMLAPHRSPVSPFPRLVTRSGLFRAAPRKNVLRGKCGATQGEQTARNNEISSTVAGYGFAPRGAGCGESPITCGRLIVDETDEGEQRHLQTIARPARL
jgi:hypothetical protein